MSYFCAWLERKRGNDDVGRFQKWRIPSATVPALADVRSLPLLQVDRPRLETRQHVMIINVMMLFF